MPSPLESRLISRIAETADAASRGVFIAELACYCARIGEFERAEAYRTDLRKAFGDGKDLRVSVLIMILEALLLYFRELNPAARDRLLRAKLLCTAAKEKRLLALTSAWLAHIDFNQERFESMAAAIATSIDSLDADDGSAECRLALVLGDAFIYCGQEIPSRRWYERARLAATRLGDQAAIGAMTYNRAALRVADLRMSMLTQDYPSVDISLAKAEVKTATNYQAVAGLLSLEHLLKASQIGILMLEQDFRGALTGIEQILESGQIPRHSGAFFTLGADRVTCMLRLGQTKPARECAQGFTEVVLESLSPDDRAMCLAALEEEARRSGERDAASSYAAGKQAALAEFTALKRKLLASIELHA